MNPNTGTLPMFRTRVDADITLGIYGPVIRVLIRDGDPEGNPWELLLPQRFSHGNDSGFSAQPNVSRTPNSTAGPTSLTEGICAAVRAKMLGHFDHRFSTYRGATQAQLNVGSLPRLSDAEHDDPDVESLARYWVDRSEVAARLADRWDHGWLLGWRNIGRSSDSRTFVPSVLPTTAVGNTFLLAFPSRPGHGPFLHSVWSSIIFDYGGRSSAAHT